MGFVADDVKQRLDVLIERGNKLYCALGYENADKEQQKVYEKQYEEIGIDASKLPNFNSSYEGWYSEAL